MRVMGLDIGDRRIGIAYASFLDMGSSIVVPAGFLLVQSREQALKDLAEMAEEEQVRSVVVGLPIRGGDDQNPQCRKISAFAKELLPLLPPGVELCYWDESLTSVAASEQLVDAELKHSKGSKRKGRVDSVAASLMLQGYVDSQRAHLPPLGPML